jgi:gliding motility-associated-like protein
MKFFLILLIVLFSFHSFAQLALCKDSSYRIRYINSDKFYLRDQTTTLDNGTVMAGIIDDQTDTLIKGFIMKVDDGGEIIWSKKIGNGLNSLTLQKIIQFSDGNFLAGGSSIVNRIKKNVLLKIDGNGNLIWNKVYQPSSHFDPTDDSYFYSLAEGNNGEILTSWKGEHLDNIYDTSYAVISKFDKNGNIIWSKAFVSNNDAFTNSAGVFIQNNEVIAIGEVEDEVNHCLDYLGEWSPGTYYGMKLNESDGSLKLLKTYCYYIPYSNSSFTGGDMARFFSARKLLNNHYSLFGTLYVTTSRNYFTYRVNFDDQLNLMQSNRYAIPKELGTLIQENVSPNNDINITIRGAGPKYYWCTLNSSNIIKRQREISFNGSTGFSGYHTYGFKNPDITTFSTNYGSGNQWYIEQMQLQPDDATFNSCLGTDTSFVTVQPFHVLPSSWTWKSVVDNAITSSDGNFTITDVAIQKENICKQVSSCDSLKISGEDSICILSQPYIFKVSRNPECNKRIEWELDTSAYNSLTYLSDTTISIIFKNPSADSAVVKLYASTTNNCGNVKDSMQITVFKAFDPLPPDTSLCLGQTLHLTPGKWFKSYLWQDGSTDSVFIADKPGIYYVRAESFCGNYLSDTIHITAPEIVTIHEVSKCNSDTIALHSIPDLVNYIWFPDENLMQASDSVAFAFPDTATTYSVSAYTKDGCAVNDTIRVTVNHSPKINLGNDTSFCKGDSVLLDAGPGFNLYQWSNGISSQKIIVSQPGFYSVAATDNNVCISNDTIQILPFLPDPDISIHNQTTLCKGQNDTLYAGNNSLSYLWQDGSSENYFHVTQPGIYWVQAVNFSNCKAMDTVTITKLYDVPADFIFSDTAVCNGDELLLRPTKNFLQYLWSNGSATSSIIVKNPGAYSLQVTDQFGCRGIASVTVKEKDCSDKIFFPSAFSPNHDGKNDLFKPIVSGALENYEFTVYNRWGQIVFKTKNKSEGWDGTIQGQQQDSGVFVWMCRYKFNNQQSGIKSGTVMLIR